MSYTDLEKSGGFVKEESGERPQNELKTVNPSLSLIFRMISFWVGYNLVNAALTSIVWPRQIELIVGEADKEFYNGVVPAVSAFVSLIVTPLAGLWSDWSTNRWGRRRPFILAGTVIGATALILCGNKLTIWLLLLLMLVFQLGINGAAGPFAGLLPDVVEKSRVGKASGYLSFANAIGNMVGVVCSGFILQNTVGFWPIYGLLTACLVVFMIPTLFVKEVPNHEPLGTSDVREIARLVAHAFYLPWEQYKNLYWVLISRFLEEMGVSATLPFFLYYLEDIIEVEDAEIWTAIAVAVTMLAGVPTSIYAGHLSDKYGRKIIVYCSVTLMSITSISLLIITVHPSLLAFILNSAIFGIGYGAYRAVDWALAIDVLPPESQIAKDMGVWHISLVLPRVLSPLISGIILQSSSSDTKGYIIVYSVSLVWFFSSIFFVSFIKTQNETQKMAKLRVTLSTSGNIENENNVLLNKDTDSAAVVTTPPSN